MKPEPELPARPTDFRLVPIAAGAWAGCWWGTGSAAWLPPVLAAGLVGVVAVAGWGRRRGGRPEPEWLGPGRSGPEWLGPGRDGRLLSLVLATLLVAVAGSVIGHLASARLTGSVAAALAEQRAVARVEVVLREDFRATGTVSRPVWVAEGTLVDLQGRGQVARQRMPVLLIATSDPGGVPVGSTVAWMGRLSPREPGDAVAAVVRVRGDGEVIRPPGWPDRLVERVRAGLRGSVANRPAAPRALVPALVLGDVSAMTPELRDEFRASGLTHLTAVSGANLSILLAFVVGAARYLGARGMWLRVVAVLTVAVFVALCRTEPSVLRAAAMGLVTLAALGSGARGARAVRHLCVATIVLLLVDPWLARAYGMALSVLACLGIVLWAGRWARLVPRPPRFLVEGVTVPLSAQVLTMPLVAKLSGQVSLASLPANMLAGPLVAPATVAGFAAAGLALLWPAGATLVGWFAALCAAGIVAVGRLGAGLPGATMVWPADPWSLIVLSVVSVAGAVITPALIRHRVVALLVAVALVVVLLRGPAQPGFPPRGWVAVFCDVGQGDTVVLAAGPGQAVVVDVGPDDAGADRCLDDLGIQTVPLLILTHFHADHVGGLARMLPGRRVGAVLTSPLGSPPAESARVAAELGGLGVPLGVAVVGSTLSVGQVELRVVGPSNTVGAGEAAGDPESSVENDASVVVVADVGGVRLLLPGDAEPMAQQAILATGADLRADVIKFPHHGSARQDRGFFTATGARLAVASAGEDNDYGHPAPAALRLAESLGMRIARTDEQGSIALARRDGGVTVVTQR